METGRGSAPLSWGFRSLDRRMKGLFPGQLTLLASWPGIGRCALALGVAEELVFGHKVPVAMLSLDVTYQQLLVRMACIHAKIDFLRLYLKGQEAAQEKFAKALGQVKTSYLRIMATPRIALGELQMEARRLRSRHDIRLFIIDHLQLVSPDVLQAGLGRQEQLIGIAAGIRKLAQELDVAVLLLSQLGEAADAGDGAMPKFSTVRETKAFEKMADVVCHLAPNEAYEEQPKVRLTDSVSAGISIVKNGKGATGDVRLRFLPRYARFEDVSR